MPHRILPRSEVPPEFSGPDFLTSSLPPSCRPGHLGQVSGRDRDARDDRSRGFPVSVTALVVLVAGLLVGLLTWHLSGAVDDGVVVGVFTGACTGLAAAMIGRPATSA